MKRSFQRLVTEQDFATFSKLYVNAYPGGTMTAEQASQRLFEVATKDDTSEFIGVLENDTLVGGMRLLDFSMNYHGSMIFAGGVGGVAVDLLHKKKGIAKDLIIHYLDYYERKGATLAFLYPFRPDFYYRMGFGYGAKMNQYSFSPSSLPLGEFCGQLDYLTADDLPLIRHFYERLVSRKHGYCLKSALEYESLLKNNAAARTLIGYKVNGELQGYLAFAFRKAHDTNFVKNNIVIREWLWATPDALHGLCHFLHTQADQINRIVYNTQDADFHWLLKDVRNGTDNIIPSVYHESNTSGIGVMYRIISLPQFVGAIAARNFNGESARLAISLEDSFRPQNRGVHHLTFDQGQVTYGQPSDRAIRVSIDIADLSALFMGSVDVTTLYNLGRLQADPAYVSTLQRVFRSDTKPECISAF